MDLDITKLDHETLIALGGLALVFLLIKLLYANSFRKAIKLVHPDNRFFTPAQAWLLVIPIINIYWNFEIARRLSDSLTNEFYDRKIAEEENPGRSIGLTLAFLYIATFFPLPVFFLIALNLAYLFYFLLYWVKVNGFKELLEDHNAFLNEQSKLNT